MKNRFFSSRIRLSFSYIIKYHAFLSLVSFKVFSAIVPGILLANIYIAIVHDSRSTIVI